METLALSVGMMVSCVSSYLCSALIADGQNLVALQIHCSIKPKTASAWLTAMLTALSLSNNQVRVSRRLFHMDFPDMERPVLQTFNMFVGECFCLIVVQLLALRTWWYTRHHQYTALSPSSVAQPTHFHSNQTLNPPNSAIAAPTPAVPLMVDPEAEAPAQDKYPSIREVQGWTRFLFALPALCDITATTLSVTSLPTNQPKTDGTARRMGAGLIWTPVSVYQMTRSALVLFVGLFSVLFLNRRLSRIELLSLFIVTAGVFIVGLSSASGHRVESAPEDAGQVILGVSLILFAQIL